MSAASDAVPIAGMEDAVRGTSHLSLENYKLVLLLFISFLVTVSTPFVDGFLARCFGEKAVRGRSVTAWGTVLQGIFLVLMYLVALYITNNQII